MFSSTVFPLDSTERTALDKLDVQDQESLQKMQQGVQPSTQLLPGSDLMPTEMGDAAKAAHGWQIGSYELSHRIASPVVHAWFGHRAVCA